MKTPNQRHVKTLILINDITFLIDDITTQFGIGDITLLQQMPNQSVKLNKHFYVHFTMI